MNCDKNGITLLLVKAPSLYPYWYDEYDEQVVDYADKYNLTYINLLKKSDETGIDYQTDTYDAGLHMNLSGAEKLSVYIGNILQNDMNVSDRRDNEELSDIWNKKIGEYEADIKKQCEYYNVTLQR